MLETAGDHPEELLGGMMEEITQPDIPPAVEEVRLMSLHKSKGLSSPFVFVAGCVEGILPPAVDPDLPKGAKDAALEEARRLFYVGITRVKSDLAKGRPGSLFISYPQQMTIKDAYGANVAFRTKSGLMANLLPESLPCRTRRGCAQTESRRRVTVVGDAGGLYAKFGITAEAAQLFETELGTVLLSAQGLEHGWHIAPDRKKARARWMKSTGARSATS